MSDSSSPSLGARQEKSFSTRICNTAPSSRICSPAKETCSVVAQASTAVSGRRTVTALSEKNAAGLTLAGLLSTRYLNSLPPGKPVLAPTMPLSRSTSTSPRVSRNRTELSLILSFTFLNRQQSMIVLRPSYFVAHAGGPPAAGGLSAPTRIRPIFLLIRLRDVVNWIDLANQR